MSTKILILGNSNSILKDGCFASLKENFDAKYINLYAYAVRSGNVINLD
jgi:hypothetical protein